MQAARDLVVSYLPGSDPIWLGGATHGEHRLDVFHASAAADVTLHVLSLALDGTFVPDLVSTRLHLPYDANAVDADPPCREALGVFARLERVHAPGALQARFDWGGRERTVLVNAGHALLIE